MPSANGGPLRRTATTLETEERIDDVTARPSERRRSLRRRQRREAFVQLASGEVLSCFTVDVSPDGACLSGRELPIHVGDVVRLSYAEPSVMAGGWQRAQVRWRSIDCIGLELIAEARRPR